MSVCVHIQHSSYAPIPLIHVCLSPYMYVLMQRSPYTPVARYTCLSLSLECMYTYTYNIHHKLPYTSIHLCVCVHPNPHMEGLGVQSWNQLCTYATGFGCPCRAHHRPVPSATAAQPSTSQAATSTAAKPSPKPSTSASALRRALRLHRRQALPQALHRHLRRGPPH